MSMSFIHHFPIPDFLAMPACALDISDESIKYGQITQFQDEFRLKYFGQENITPGVVVSGKIEDEDSLIQVLGTIKKKQQIKFVRVCLPEEQMYLFNLVLPKQEDKEMTETILLQLEDHVPIPAPNAVFDYEIIREVDDSNVLVKVVATDNALVQSYLSVFSKAGLVPLSFELEDQAIARALVPKDSQDSVMIVDFGRTRTGISIVEEGRVNFTSTFNVGGQNITEVIAKNFKVSMDEAEQMKYEYSKLGSDAENDIFPVIIANLSILLDEIRKQYSYWNSHESEDSQPHAKIKKVILCGGEANLYGLVPYFKTSMDVPVEYGNVWTNIQDISKDLPSMTFDESLSYATVFGLALGGFLKE